MDTIVTTLLYKLTFGNYIGDPGNKVDELVLRQYEGTDFAEEGTGNTYSVFLLGVKMNRKIYQPGEIEVELDFVPSSGNKTKAPPLMDGVKDLFHNRIVSMSIVHVNENVSSHKWVIAGDEHIQAENYYVHEINPQLKRDIDSVRMSVKLKIFSMDKLMTLNKYSKAYVARKLGSGILMPESRNFEYKKCGDTPLVKTDVSSMRFLRYTENMVFSIDKGQAQTVKIASEFIHPYLVQYNETFYDFLVRTANRYGEFLFFEDGQLYLGLPDSGEPLVIDKFSAVTTQNVTTGPVNVSYYARDSVKNGDGETDKLNFTAVELGKDGYPKDTFTGDLKYNSEVSADEFIFPLYKDKFSSLSYEMYLDGTHVENTMAKTVPIVRDFISGTAGGVGGGVGPAIKQVLADWSSLVGIAGMASNSTNAAGNKDYLIPLKNKTEQSDENAAVHFGTLDKNGWTTVNYYGEIHSHEQEQEKKIICIDMDTTVAFVKLGQKIKVPGLADTYVIIQIQQISDVEWSGNYQKYDEGTTDAHGGQRSMKIFAIPAVKANNEEVFYPPVQPVPVIRKAGPQTAFVMDNTDPKKQGRVRVAYPWQTLNPNLKADLEEASHSLTEIKNRYDAAKKEIERLSAQMTDLTLEQTTLLAYLKMTDAEREEADKKDAEELAELEKKKTKHELERDYKLKQIEELKANTDLAPEERQKLLDKLEVEKEALQIVVLKDNVEAHNEAIDVTQQKIDRLKQKMARKKEALDARESGKKPEDNPVYKLLGDQVESLKKNKAEIAEQQKSTEKAQTVAEERVDKAKKEIEKTMKDFSTPWIRVATPMATQGGGTYFKPRLGDEVLVNYDNSNVERPYVVGSLFSKNLLVPEDGFTRSYNSAPNRYNTSMSMVSPNGHHITFMDPNTGAFQFFSNVVSPGLGFYAPLAAKTLGISFGESVKDLAGGIHIGDRYGIYEISMSSDKRNISIKSPFGDVDVSAFSGITISAPNGDVKIAGQNICIEAGNKIEIRSGKNVSAPSIGQPSGKGTNLGYAIGAGAEAGITVVNDMFGASVVDFSLIRHVVEVFVRPVEGTMLLKSRKYLKLEAGLGRAMVQKDRFADKLMNPNRDQELFFKRMLECVQHITNGVDASFSLYKTHWEDAYQKKQAYENRVQGIVANVADPNIAKKAYAVAAAKGLWSNESLVLSDFNGKVVQGMVLKEGTQLETAEAKFNYVKEAALSYGKACYLLYMIALNFGVGRWAHVNDQFSWVTNHVGQYGADDYISIKQASWTDTFGDGKAPFLSTATPQIIQDPFRPDNKKAYKRAALLTFMHYVAADPENLHKVKGTRILRQSKWFAADYDLNRLTKDAKRSQYYLTTEFWWKHQIEHMDHFVQNNWWRHIWDASFGHIYDKFWSNFRPLDKDMWNDGEGGQILFSDREDRTLEFNDNDHLEAKNEANMYSLAHLKEELKKC